MPGVLGQACFFKLLSYEGILPWSLPMSLIAINTNMNISPNSIAAIWVGHDVFITEGGRHKRKVLSLCLYYIQSRLDIHSNEMYCCVCSMASAGLGRHCGSERCNISVCSRQPDCQKKPMECIQDHTEDSRAATLPPSPHPQPQQ